MTAGRPRWIAHLDMDAFYAAIEQRDHPELRGKPVIVGGSRRGVVSTASYEARVFGVRSAMPSATARRLCPHGVFLPVRMARYLEVSRQVMAVLDRFSPVVEVTSVDEAYLDVTGCEGLFGPPLQLGAALKAAVLAATGLTCSVGLAPNRTLAKMAAEANKPDGLRVLAPADVPAFLAGLPLARLPGVGPKTGETLRRLWARRVGDLLTQPVDFWVRHLGQHGALLAQRARGADDTPLEPHGARRSCGAEDTFPEDCDDREVLTSWLLHQAERVAADLRREGLRGRTVTVKFKFADFAACTRAHTLPQGTASTAVIFATARDLLAAMALPRPLRLIGITVSQLAAGEVQPGLFADESQARTDRLEAAVDAVRERFGTAAVRRGRLLRFDPERG